MRPLNFTPTKSSISIPYLALKLGRTDSVVQTHLRALIAKGIIKCQRQKTLSKKKYVTKDGEVQQAYVNIPNLYTIIGRYAPCYRGTPYEPAPQKKDKIIVRQKTGKTIPDFQYHKTLRRENLKIL